MDKAKRKDQPVNLKKYWIGIGLLGILMLFPIRLSGYWVGDYPDVTHTHFTGFNYALYLCLCVVIGLLLYRIICIFYAYRIRTSIILIVALICYLPVSYHHAKNADHVKTCSGTLYLTETSAFIGNVGCTGHIGGACCWRLFIGIKYVPLVIDYNWIGAIVLPRQQIWNDG